MCRAKWCEAHCVNLIWRKLYLNSKKNNLYFIVSDTEQLNALAN